MGQIDDILVAGGIAGLVGASIRLGFSWLTYAAGWQRMTLSHIYSLLFLRTIGPGGLVVGSIAVLGTWTLLGVVLAQLLAWYGFRYWWLKGPGLILATWPLMYIGAQLAYRGPAAVPGAANALTSLSVSLVAGLTMAGLLARWARWPGRAGLGPGPFAPVHSRTLRDGDSPG